MPSTTRECLFLYQNKRHNLLAAVAPTRLENTRISEAADLSVYIEEDERIHLHPPMGAYVLLCQCPRQHLRGTVLLESRSLSRIYTAFCRSGARVRASWEAGQCHDSDDSDEDGDYSCE